MFALTPQTEEKYKKIDEEFDRMMQSYRLAVSSRMEKQLPAVCMVWLRLPRPGFALRHTGAAGDRCGTSALGRGEPGSLAELIWQRPGACVADACALGDGDVEKGPESRWWCGWRPLGLP